MVSQTTRSFPNAVKLRIGGALKLMHPVVLFNLKKYLILKCRHENEICRYGTKDYFRQ